MSDLSDIPRYGLRKRPTNNDVLSHKKVKQKSASLPPSDAPSGVARPVTPKSGVRKLRDSTLNKKPTSSPLNKADTPTRSQQQQKSAPKSSPPQNAPSGLERPVSPKDASNLTSSPLTSLYSLSPCQEQLIPNDPSANDTAAVVPHKLTINGRTFTGPLPPNKTTDPTGNAANIPGDHGSYKLFVCADCPIPQKDKQNGQNDLHTLCYPSHPCLWSFPPKAREAFANRAHWLSLDKPLEATRRPNGRLPRLLDEDGEPVTRGLVDVQKGVDLNRAYDEVVMKRYTAVIKSEECCEVRGMKEGDARLEEHRLGHRVAREEMLGDMGWGFWW